MSEESCVVQWGHRCGIEWNMSDHRCPHRKEDNVSFSSLLRQDESLFGPPQHLLQMTGNRDWGSTSAPTLHKGGSSQARTGGRRTSDTEVVQVVTKDLIRKIK